MKPIRIILWVAVVVSALVAGYLFSKPTDTAQTNSAFKLGGPFELVTHEGKPITQEAFKNRPHALFFGFTHCPDVCPITLQDVTVWLKQLGDDGDKLDFYFVTADPERDTVENIANYVGAFDKRIVGITGNPEEIFKMAKSYKIYIKKVPLEDDDYTVDHTASIYLFDRSGYFKGTIAYGENYETAIAKVRRVIDAK